MKKIWIFAGETSGDIYGAMLAKEIKKQDNSVAISGMGGMHMKEAEVDILVDSTELGVVGFIEVLKHIKTFKRIFNDLVEQAIKEKPDAIVLIDYPGFNLRFAEKMYENNIPVLWYISPQVWAWGKKRIPKFAKYCRKMFCIFPFEPDVFKETNLDVQFVGHPLVEVIEKRKSAEIVRNNNRCLLLPGSRLNEVNKLLKPMLETTVLLKKEFPELEFIISTPREKIENRIKEIYSEFKNNNSNCPKIEISTGKTGELLLTSSYGIAASGTVTVECAISGLPLVVVYKMNPLTYLMAKLLVKIPYFTMINIVLNREVYNEFLQGKVNSQNIFNALQKIIPEGKNKDNVRDSLNEFIQKISGDSEGATAKVAKECLKFINN